MTDGTVVAVFLACVEAVRQRKLIVRESAADKEFHFQRWFAQRLSDLHISFASPKRNTYPDFRLSATPEGYEVKGLAFPGRYKSYDANSEVPMGRHDDRDIYYVFGRYPTGTATEFPVLDLVICHGDFLNKDYEYKHLNQSVRGFGSYGDIMIRDRKMYVAPTPFALVPKTEGKLTLILGADAKVETKELKRIGEPLLRREAKEIVVAYDFDLREGKGLSSKTKPNLSAGREHAFQAYRAKVDDDDTLELVQPKLEETDLDADEKS